MRHAYRTSANKQAHCVRRGVCPTSGAVIQYFARKCNITYLFAGPICIKKNPETFARNRLDASGKSRTHILCMCVLAHINFGQFIRANTIAVD